MAELTQLNAFSIFFTLNRLIQLSPGEKDNRSDFNYNYNFWLLPQLDKARENKKVEC